MAKGQLVVEVFLVHGYLCAIFVYFLLDILKLIRMVELSNEVPRLYLESIHGFFKLVSILVPHKILFLVIGFHPTFYRCRYNTRICPRALKEEFECQEHAENVNYGHDYFEDQQNLPVHKHNDTHIQNSGNQNQKGSE